MINMYGQLSNGIEVLDVGCGAGFHMNELASHFPNSRFVGIDIGAEGIRQAQHEAHEKHLHNTNSTWSLFSMLVMTKHAQIWQLWKCTVALNRRSVCNGRTTFGYAASLFHCLPVGSNSDDALQLGAMWVLRKAKCCWSPLGLSL
uniref:Methyltransferase domain-containing protein n=1 Tax=Ditylenchus dipsaci TaxID=166011 RepID=A0A915ESH1_9BILA